MAYNKIQPMPELSADELETLRVDIAENGVLVPVVKDQHGRIIDGNNRATIADELGIDYPVQVIEVKDDREAWDRAIVLNCTRRHLTREQVRDIIAAEIRRCPNDSDRPVSRRVGCSPTTVGSVRTELREDARRLTDQLVEYVNSFRYSLCGEVVRLHDEKGWDWQRAADVVERSTWAELSNLDSWMAPEEVFGPILGPVFDALRAQNCDSSCEVCTPAFRKWRNQFPGQVYRWTPPEVSNLDTTEPASTSPQRS